MRKHVLTIVLLAVIPVLHGQILQSTQFAKGSISDGVKIIGAYLQPLEHSFNAISGSGFVNFQSDAQNKKISFRLGLQVVGAITPESEKTYDVISLNLSEFHPVDPLLSIAQTFSGNSGKILLGTNASYRVLTTTYPFSATKPILTLNSPEGTGTSVLNLAFITASINSNGSELSLRIMPPVKVPKTDAVVYSAGGSMQTEFTKLVKSLQSFPVGLTFLVGLQYTKLSLNPGLEPDSTRVEISLQSNNGPYDNQNFNVISIAFPLEILVHKEINKFTLYTGAGINLAKSKVELKGNIPLYKADPTNTLKIIVEDIKDPFSYSRLDNTPQFHLGAKYFHKSMGLNTGFYFSKYLSYYLGIDLTI